MNKFQLYNIKIKCIIIYIYIYIYIYILLVTNTPNLYNKYFSLVSLHNVMILLYVHRAPE